MLKWLSFALTIIFVIAKLFGLLAWSWLCCFIPIIAYVSLQLLVVIITLIAGLVGVAISENDSNEKGKAKWKKELEKAKREKERLEREKEENINRK